MYIQPNTTIKLFNNIPLTPDYSHTFYFSSLPAQNNFFHGQINPKYVLSNNSYQRVEKGVMRVGVKADNIYDCNYLAFQNSNYGNKWFYAFITGVEYINSETSQISFQIDVIQTYLYDGFIMNECFIEREHSKTDDYNDWLVPENLETGEYIIDDYITLSYGTLEVKMFSPDNVYEEQEQVPVMFAPSQGLMTGVSGPTFSNNVQGASQLADLISYMETIGTASKIIDLSIAPSCCTGRSENITINKPTKVDGYTPKNKKVLTSPYCFLVADDNQGHTAEYLFELFRDGANNDKAYFEATGNVVPTTTVWSIPKYYKNCEVNYNEALVTTGFPSVPFNVDSYKEYIAQNKNTLTLAGAVAGAEIGIGAIKMAASEGATGGQDLVRGVLGVAGLLARTEDKKVGAIRSAGRQVGDGVPYKRNIVGTRYYTKCITNSMARVIDDFFTMYGYATHKVKKPNIFLGGNNMRPNWNYIKTKNCNAFGKCPADDLQKICSIFDTGITFWNPDSFGRYDLDNSPR